MHKFPFSYGCLFSLGNAVVGFLNGKNSQCIEKDVTLLFILIGCTRTKTFSVCIAQYSKVSIENCKTHFFIGQRKGSCYFVAVNFFTLRTFAKDTHRESSARFTAARCVVK